MDFSLLFFANREAHDPPAEYELLFEASEYADKNSFKAVWLPERHFHPFGGAYPNAALAAAAVAARTTSLRLRAGSVVLPLHDPLRVVEDWAFVDNLSRGRVDLSVAPGWNANDFVLAPDSYNDRRAELWSRLAQVVATWAGQPLTRRNGEGELHPTLTYPRPVQSRLTVWLTCASSRASFRAAGAAGLHVLTALLFQTPEELERNIDVYRRAREEAGYDPQAGIVTVMVHSWVGVDDAHVRAVVFEPFVHYLSSSIDLWSQYWSELRSVSRSELAAAAYERYARSAAMFGSIKRCAELATSLESKGVDEVAALIDFGISRGETMQGLERLNQVREAIQTGSVRR